MFVYCLKRLEVDRRRQFVLLVEVSARRVALDVDCWAVFVLRAAPLIRVHWLVAGCWRVA